MVGVISGPLTLLAVVTGGFPSVLADMIAILLVNPPSILDRTYVLYDEFSAKFRLIQRCVLSG
jgi:hypothetical protein